MNMQQTTNFPVLTRRDFVSATAGAALLFAMNGLPLSARAATAHALPPLPYADNALEPVISANTIGFHYGKHHEGYVEQPEQARRRIRSTPICHWRRSSRRPPGRLSQGRHFQQRGPGVEPHLLLEQPEAKRRRRSRRRR